MRNTDGLSVDSPVQEKYVFRLGRAVLMLAFGALMHLPSPSGPGIVPPAISPRPFVRVAAQQTDSNDAPAVIIAHSLVFAALPRTDGLLQASDSREETPIGTAGLDEPAHAVALVELQATDDVAVPRENEKSDSTPDPVKVSSEAPADAPKRSVIERPLPAVVAPPANDLPPTAQAFAAPALNAAPPSTYRVAPIVAVTRTVSEEELVRQLLDEYTGAFERRDIGAQKALYPNVDGKALKRAYEQIESQRLTLESCGITISGTTANARCRGSATFQPRIGTRPVQVASREWTFDLSKQDTAWRIVNTYVR